MVPAPAPRRARALPALRRWLPLAAALALCLPARAVITRLYPLGDILADADAVVAATVAARDTRAHVVTVKRSAVLKGKPDWTRARFRLAGGDDRSQLPILEKRLAPGRTVLLFAKERRFALGYVEGTWFRLAYPASAGGAWQFVHLEPYLRRTFRGTSAEMRRVAAGVLAGTARAPAPDPDVPPGHGE